MASLWKRIRKRDNGPCSVGEIQSTIPSPIDANNANGVKTNMGFASIFIQSNQLGLIQPEDEQLFQGNFSAAIKDPLNAQSQFLRSAHELLSFPGTQPYFLQFLDAYDARKLALFWLEADLFQRAAAKACSNCTNVANCNSAAKSSGTSIISHDSCIENYSDGSVSISKVNLSRLGKCYKENNGMSTKPEELRNCVLPELVNNITVEPTDVTPMHSPGGNGYSENTKSDPMASQQVTHSKSTENEILTKFEDDTMKVKTELGEYTLSEATNHVLPPTVICEAIRIFNRYMPRNAEMELGLNGDAIEQLSRNITGGTFDSKCFSVIQNAVLDILDDEFIPRFIVSDFYLKHRIDVLTSGSVLLPDILENDTNFPCFMEYSEQEGGRSLLEFWVAASNFRNQLMYGVYNPMHAQEDAVVLYEKYFSLQAKTPLGFSDAMRLRVELNICQEEGPLPTCFDEPLRVVLHLLQRDFLPGYLASNLHIKYLSELVNTFRNSAQVNGSRTRTVMSNCATSGSGASSASVTLSRGSVTSRNTLLATDSSHHHVANNTQPTLTASMMRIDSIQLTDPDSLWKRKKYMKLSCGFVNEFGRFESELLPDPQQKNVSTISKTLKRWVNTGEDKVKEDMAYQVAEMIIRDVTNVTLAGSPLSPIASSMHASRSFGSTSEFMGSRSSHDEDDDDTRRITFYDHDVESMNL